MCTGRVSEMPLEMATGAGLRAVRAAPHFIATLSACPISDRGLLEAVSRLSGKWMEQLIANDPRRQSLSHLASLVKAYLEAEDYSTMAMTTARALLCVNCRRLDAVRGECSGRALHHCQLLRAEFQEGPPHAAFAMAAALS